MSYTALDFTNCPRCSGPVRLTFSSEAGTYISQCCNLRASRDGYDWDWESINKIAEPTWRCRSNLQDPKTWNFPPALNKVWNVAPGSDYKRHERARGWGW